MTQRATPGRGVALLLVLTATAGWVFQEYTGGLLMREYHAAQVVALRCATHLLLLLPLVLLRHGWRGFSSARKRLQVLRGLCMFGMPACYILAAGITTPQWTWVVFWSMPALALLGARVMLQERTSVSAWLGAGLALPAAALVLRPDGVPGVFAVSAAGGMGASFAGYLVLSRELRHERLGASLLYTALGALLPMCLALPRVWSALLPGDVVPALATGALSLLILTAFDIALAHATLALVAPLVPLVLIIEVGLGVLLVPDVARGAIPGAALAGAGVLLALAGNARWHRHEQGRAATVPAVDAKAKAIPGATVAAAGSTPGGGE